MGRQVAVVVYESNRKSPDPKVRIAEKDIPSAGEGEVLVRITLRPVREGTTDLSVDIQEFSLACSSLELLCQVPLALP